MKNLQSHLLDPLLYVIHLSFYCILWIHLAQIYAHINIIMRRNYCCHQWMCLAGCQGVHWLLGRCQRLWKTSILSNHKIVFDWGGIMNSCSVCDGQISLLWNQCSALWLANRSTAIEVFGPDFSGAGSAASWDLVSTKGVWSLGDPLLVTGSPARLLPSMLSAAPSWAGSCCSWVVEKTFGLEGV